MADPFRRAAVCFLWVRFQGFLGSCMCSPTCVFRDTRRPWFGCPPLEDTKALLWKTQRSRSHTEPVPEKPASPQQHTQSCPTPHSSHECTGCQDVLIKWVQPTGLECQEDKQAKKPEQREHERKEGRASCTPHTRLRVDSHDSLMRPLSRLQLP